MKVPKARIPAAFGPDRMTRVWNLGPYDRAKPFWEALEWLRLGHWHGVVAESRMHELGNGIFKGVSGTCADLLREYERDGQWRDWSWKLWRRNQLTNDDPKCLYRTGIIPPRLFCYPAGEPYPVDALELAELHDEVKAWSQSVAGRAFLTPEQITKIGEDASLISSIAMGLLKNDFHIMQ